MLLLVATHEHVAHVDDEREEDGHVDDDVVLEELVLQAAAQVVGDESVEVVACRRGGVVRLLLLELLFVDVVDVHLVGIGAVDLVEALDAVGDHAVAHQRDEQDERHGGEKRQRDEYEHATLLERVGEYELDGAQAQRDHRVALVVFVVAFFASAVGAEQRWVVTVAASGELVVDLAALEVVLHVEALVMRGGGGGRAAAAELDVVEELDEEDHHEAEYDQADGDQHLNALHAPFRTTRQSTF